MPTKKTTKKTTKSAPLPVAKKTEATKAKAKGTSAKVTRGLASFLSGTIALATKIRDCAVVIASDQDAVLAESDAVVRDVIRENGGRPQGNAVMTVLLAVGYRVCGCVVADPCGAFHTTGKKLAVDWSESAKVGKRPAWFKADKDKTNHHALYRRALNMRSKLRGVLASGHTGKVTMQDLDLAGKGSGGGGGIGRFATKKQETISKDTKSLMKSLEGKDSAVSRLVQWLLDHGDDQHLVQVAAVAKMFTDNERQDLLFYAVDCGIDSDVIEDYSKHTGCVLADIV